jgi:hypothetical protein
MSKLIIISILGSVLILSCQQGPNPIVDSRHDDYALYDETGSFHRLSYYNDCKAIVLYVQGNGCPIIRNAMDDLRQVVDEYSERGVTFFMINSNIQDNRKNIRKEAVEFDFPVPVLIDEVQLIADALDINITAEAIVLDPITREILFRGPINDRLDYESQKGSIRNHYLKEALDHILEKETIESKRIFTKGCKVTRLSTINKYRELTYTEDIAPILESHCVRCHNENGIAPWSMTDYNTILGWSSMMKEVLISKRMPPWKADPYIGEFENSFAIEDSNVRKIIQWIDGGMSYGNGVDPLTSIDIKDKGWQAGSPDKIVTLKNEIVPASKLIPYRYQQIDLDLEEDTWLRGVEIKPGNSKVVHHIVLTNTETNKQSLITSRKTLPWTDNYIALGGGADQLTMFPENTGVLLLKGTVLTIQIHYTPIGKEVIDQTRLGFYFHEDPPDKEFYALSPSNIDFTIPPFARNYRLTAVDSIERDIDIHYIVPHMHYRGKSIKFMVEFPNDSLSTIVSIPDFNFNWQWLYKLKNPLSIPKGSKIIVEGIYDNSFQNPLNPDPYQELKYGIQSTDEMLIGFFNYTLNE